MFRRKFYKTRAEKTALPNELWLLIFNIVIEEGIIWLERCDYTTFPHVVTSFFNPAHCHQFYDSYYRLRLVCRKFNSLLSTQPWQSFSNPPSLPIPISTRALHLGALGERHFRCLLGETLACERLVYIDATCDLSYSSGRLNLSEFFRTGRVFRNVQRLSLRLVNSTSVYSRPQISFWICLHQAFSSLVTLALATGNGVTLESKVGEDVVCFERLEILHFDGDISYSGCHFPRLRHASVWGCTERDLQILTRSAYLRSLLIRGPLDCIIDVASCPSLKLLGLPDSVFIKVVGLDRDHPMEHIWLYTLSSLRNPDLFELVSKELPRVSRITVEYASYAYMQGVDEPPEVRLGSFVLSTRPHGDHFLVAERERPTRTSGITGVVLRKVWSKMRR